MTFTEANFQAAQGDPSIYAIPIYIFFIGFELFLNVKQNLHLYTTKDSFASIAMGVGSVIIGILTKTLFFLLFTFIYQFKIFNFSMDWIMWIILFFADDLTFYWHHRLSHQVRILWAAHIHHHSSQHFNFTTALRQSWGEPFYKFFFWMWLPLIGFSPISVLVMHSISLIYQFFLHTETIKRLGFIAYFFNTPSHHRVHHATQVKYLDKNHAGVLIIWDKIFGTFVHEDKNEHPKYGITVNIDTYNPLKIATHELKNIWVDVKSTSSFKNKLKYVFYPPGWRHDGELMTSKYLQKKMKG
jgi:sterol desaturase/sphingolipid hydroxylase (fatty acid hydroxylase superfamily)